MARPGKGVGASESTRKRMLAPMLKGDGRVLSKDSNNNNVELGRWSGGEERKERKEKKRTAGCPWGLGRQILLLIGEVGTKDTTTRGSEAVIELKKNFKMMGPSQAKPHRFGETWHASAKQLIERNPPVPPRVPDPRLDAACCYNPIGTGDARWGNGPLGITVIQFTGQLAPFAMHLLAPTWHLFSVGDAGPPFSLTGLTLGGLVLASVCNSVVGGRQWPPF